MSEQLQHIIDSEHERWALNISSALRSLRRYGFFVVQDPNAAALPAPDQQRQAREAACHLLAVPANNENLSTHAVHELARMLLEDGAAGLKHIRGLE
ncbi:hypothetical protein [Paraburkholderia sp.]|uniref:hypothetical protein n=1 Tax=Paraburkholderia sp. TaxID=1926495 RepID=UPI0025FF33D8|nr:hypothetical protein [Paraburkholderia sp.]